MDFFEQNWASLGQGGHMVERTSANDAILKPAIGSFNFSLGLWGQGVNDIGVHQS